MSTAIPPRADRLSHQGYDIVNILLLGGDDELTDDNFARTDTMIVLSINRSTNTVAMLSLPRDLFVYIPTGTMQRLNVA
jgi:anionic cell wall polymer biosynthesis LytR-Cps2A-Psr (LCP) family protein